MTTVTVNLIGGPYDGEKMEIDLGCEIIYRTEKIPPASVLDNFSKPNNKTLKIYMYKKQIFCHGRTFWYEYHCINP